jgi:hypothetical protein
MKGKDIRERRRHERVRKAIEVEHSTASVLGRGKTKNISPGGMLLQAGERYMTGDQINLSVYLPDGSVSRLKGIVRHTTPASPGEHAADKHSIGIEFVEVDDVFTNFMAGLVDDIRAEDLICPSCGAEYNLTQERVNLAHRCRLCGVLLELK